MKIIIVGFGAAGIHYFKLLKNLKKKIFILDNKKIPKSKFYEVVSFQKIIKENIKFDFAIIASPSGLHYKHASFFLKRKSNVLIENLCSKTSACKIFNTNIKKFKVKCWTALQNRYNLATTYLKKELKEMQ